jgi:hypothetical protein
MGKVVRQITSNSGAWHRQTQCRKWHWLKLNGWRTFRVRSDDDSHVYSKEMACPASAEQGKRLTCQDCMACSGGIDSKKASVTIVVHGSLKNRFNNSLGV